MAGRMRVLGDSSRDGERDHEEASVENQRSFGRYSGMADGEDVEDPMVGLPVRDGVNGDRRKVLAGLVEDVSMSMSEWAQPNFTW